MKMRILLPLLGLLTALALSSCASTSEPKVKKTSWTLEADEATQAPALLLVGMSQEEVLERLGKPKRKFTREKDGIETNTWLYARKVRGPQIARTMRTGSGYVTVMQHSRWIDAVRIKFVDNVITEVRVKRRVEQESERGALHSG